MSTPARQVLRSKGKSARDEMCVVADGGLPADTQDWLPPNAGAGSSSPDSGPSRIVSHISAANQELLSEHVLGGSTRTACISTSSRAAGSRSYCASSTPRFRCPACRRRPEAPARP